MVAHNVGWLEEISEEDQRALAEKIAKQMYKPQDPRIFRKDEFLMGVEGNPGGDHVGGLHPLYGGLHEVRNPALEPPCRLCLPGAGRLLHL